MNLFQAGALAANSPGVVNAPGLVGPDFLAALIALIRSSVELKHWVGVKFGEGPFGALGFDAVKAWDERVPQETTYPYVVLTDYDESGPGLTYEDFPIRVTVNVFGTSVDQVRRIAASVKRLLDPPNLNPQATPRPQIACSRGLESYNTRDASRPQFASLGRGGVNVYVEPIDYTFIVNPYQ